MPPLAATSDRELLSIQPVAPVRPVTGQDWARNLLVQKSRSSQRGQDYAGQADQLRQLIQSMQGMDPGSRSALVAALQTRGIIQGEPEDAYKPSPLPMSAAKSVVDSSEFFDAGPPIQSNGFARYGQSMAWKLQKPRTANAFRGYSQ